MTKVDQYGAPELRSRYRPYLLRGLIFSLVVHGFLASIYWVSRALQASEPTVRHVYIMRYADLGPPPSIQRDFLQGMPSAKYSYADFNYGVPVPVPDIDVKEEKPFPTQEQLSETGNTKGEGGGGGLSIPDSVYADLLGNDLEGVTPDTYPVLMKIVVPLYPESALKKKIGGTVLVNVLVDERGNVKSASVLKTDAVELNQAAIDAAKKYTFTPGIYRGKPIPVWVAIPIRFRFEGN